MKKRMKKASHIPMMKKIKGHLRRHSFKRLTTEQIVVGALIGLSAALVIISFGVMIVAH